ncbi:hypothetical protein TraAM80_04191 [Trypanosoma rangeli]|uniref:Uncharacterized protein n=1 Tax=Trypanosoma rangeli TaxID=5698 RepID=A0A422NKM7_TRYRA|nr:uncharacterized protein TraAM80_04191 [Trypanosoma rangeli]RNF06037.1 hypothetical protein TraAM80_04191 [Trypanosoma rangeli]|eukprot:RNF06037.1 hypothetical protein TraAM80_04191 [Trypanosoma rangeli]
MNRRLGNDQPALPDGVPVTYYATCRRIEYLASLGMPQVTPYTEPARPHARTLPEPSSTPEPVLPPASPSSPGARTRLSRQTVSSSRIMTPRASSRHKHEVDKFDMEAAYAAFIRRLERKLDAEDTKSA